MNFVTREKLSIKAIASGLFAGIIIGILAYVVVGVIEGVFYPVPDGSVVSLVIEISIDIFSCVFGGWLTYKMAKTSPMGNVLVMGVLSVLFVCLSALFIKWDDPLWFKYLDIIIIIPATYLGGIIQNHLSKNISKVIL